MDTSNEKSQQEIINQIYDYAANLMVNEKKSAVETKSVLINQGLDEESASIVVNNLQQQIRDAKKERANKDMLYGALWCIGGTVATVADFGYIFWGAIVFGGIQFFKGLINTLSD
jgi:hypothetical protein